MFNKIKKPTPEQLDKKERKVKMTNKINDNQMQVVYEVVVVDGQPHFFLDLEKAKTWLTFSEKEYKTLYGESFEVNTSIRAIFFDTIPDALTKAIESEQLINDDFYNIIENNMLYAINVVWD